MNEILKAQCDKIIAKMRGYLEPMVDEQMDQACLDSGFPLWVPRRYPIPNHLSIVRYQ